MTSESFPRERRVRLRRDYQRLQKSRVRASTAHFVFTGELLQSEPPETPSRMGLVVSRRVGCAVERNRVKRLSREVFRRHLRTSSGMAIVAIAKPGAAVLSLEQLMREWVTGFSTLERKLRLAVATP